MLAVAWPASCVVFVGHAVLGVCKDSSRENFVPGPKPSEAGRCRALKGTTRAMLVAPFANDCCILLPITQQPVINCLSVHFRRPFTVEWTGENDERKTNVDLHVQIDLHYCGDDCDNPVNNRTVDAKAGVTIARC